MGIRVGIDLGTTFSAVARIEPETGRPVVIKNSFGSAITPSVLCFEQDGNVLFGEEAKNMLSMGEANAVAFFKRSMGREGFSLDIRGKSYTAADLSAILLGKLKGEAEQQCGCKIDAAVITVPAYFTHRERSATIEAGRRAGLDVIATINEPTAAAFAYGLTKKSCSQTVLIYDLGGGTFDVTLARIGQKEIDILGSDGNHELGGKDWDDCIARYLASEFYEKYGVNITKDPGMAASLTVTAETVKKQLTARNLVSVSITYKDICGFVEISEETFRAVSRFLMGITRDVTERLFSSVAMTWRDVDGVILAGGSTRMRMIRDYVREMSGKEPLGGINVDEAVALGAAIRANISEKGEILALPDGRRESGGCLTIHGARAVTDITAHSLGIISASPDGKSYINSIIIRKNTKIPAVSARPFEFRTKTKDNEMDVYVLQGEHLRPLDNVVAGKYVVSGIERTSSPKSIIEVAYRYTADGVIQVSALQKETGKQLSVKTEPVPEDMSWTDGSPVVHIETTKMPEIDVLLTIDLSGSMYGSPLTEAQLAMKGFVDQLDSSHTRIGLLPFADEAKCEVPPTNDFEKVKRMIDMLEVDGYYGYCNYGHPFNIGYKELQKGHADVKYIIVLTDGVWSCCQEAINAAKMCHEAGIEVMALGFGDADYAFLKKIASTDKFASVTELSGLCASFSRIAQAIGEDSRGLTVL